MHMIVLYGFKLPALNQRTSHRSLAVDGRIASFGAYFKKELSAVQDQGFFCCKAKQGQFPGKFFTCETLQLAGFNSEEVFDSGDNACFR